MKQKQIVNMLVGVSLVIVAGLAGSCTKQDLYDSEYGKKPFPDESELFDFSMRRNVDLYVDYDLPGYQVLIEVYGENPLANQDNERMKKPGIEALFKIYTDANGRFEGKMNIPAALESVYLYTGAWGLPGCVKLDIKDEAVRYDMASGRSSSTRAVTRSYSFDDTKVPYVVDLRRNLYSLCRWGQLGDLYYDGRLEQYGKDPFINKGYISRVEEIGNENMQLFAARMQEFFTPGGKLQDNSGLVKGPETTNLHLKKPAEISLIFVNKDAEYHNTFGYYYYKEGEKVDVKTVKKYILFPNVDNKGSLYAYPPLKSGDKVKLQYFGENGNDKASAEFPAGYVIGWFIYANGYVYDLTFSRADSDEIGAGAKLITTDDRNEQRYVTLSDKKSGKLIIGVEDAYNNSFCDLLFYAESTPADAVDNPDRPSMPDPGEPEEPAKDQNELTKGTLAFEDVWPSGGDYDMNDVIVEYERDVYFGKDNNVTKIVDTFRPVWDGAVYTSAFAYQLAKGQTGKVNLPAGTVMETETSSIVVYPNNKTAKGNTYVITREFDNATSFHKKELQNYNPYIIVNYVSGDHLRTEVHLPKTERTIWADPSLSGSRDDAYYIDRSGAYPFAVDIPVWDFRPVTEYVHIDNPDQYPRFARWAESYGKENKDWYMHYGK